MYLRIYLFIYVPDTFKAMEMPHFREILVYSSVLKHLSERGPRHTSTSSTLQSGSSSTFKTHLYSANYTVLHEKVTADDDLA